MLARLFVALALYSAGLAHAAQPHVLLDHRLTGSSKGDSTVKLDYSLHVTNPGATPLTHLTLSLVPHPPYLTKRTIVTVGDLAPRQSVYLPLRVETPKLPDLDGYLSSPLFWSGKCLDGEGKPIVFPAVSKPGGAK